MVTKRRNRETQRRTQGQTQRRKKCILCGKGIGGSDPFSTYRVAGAIKGFQRNIDLEKAFHNECVAKEEGVNEIARAQVLDYLEAMQFNKSVIEDLRGDNLNRAKKLIKELEWRKRYEK